MISQIARHSFHLSCRRVQIPRDWELQVLQCPGHTIDSVSLVFPADHSLFTTGDTVLGQGIEDWETTSTTLHGPVAKSHGRRDPRMFIKLLQLHPIATHRD
jgi:glyoxylase-like metal-dependent hydrolase (beta-lactamase superfamily II)